MTAEQIFEAARLWNLSMDTQEIATRLRMPEAWIYGKMRAVRVAAMAQRNALRRTA
jgi:uncharacterized membrane protein